jgi:hypothetical protein
MPGRGRDFFLFAATLRLALGSTQPPIHWMLEALSLGVKWLGCEAGHALPSSVKVKKV